MGDLYQGLRDYPKNNFWSILAANNSLDTAKDWKVFGQKCPKQEADRAPQKNGRRLYERTLLWYAPRPSGGMTMVPVWYTTATCPECEKRRRAWEQDYLDTHGLESELFEGESYSPIFEQDGKYVCSECGLEYPAQDFDEITIVDLLNSIKYVENRNDFIEIYRAELCDRANEYLESIPLPERQLSQQLLDAEREYDQCAENAKRDRAKLPRERPKVHTTSVPNVCVIKEITIPHPVLAGKTRCIQNAFIYIDPDNNRAYVKVNYTADEIDKIDGAGVYDHCYEIRNDSGVLLPIPESVRKTIRVLSSGGRNADIDLSTIDALLSDKKPRTYAEIDRACGWPHSTAKRLVDKRPDLFQVDNDKRRSGKPRRVTLRTESIPSDQVEQNDRIECVYIEEKENSPMPEQTIF